MRKLLLLAVAALIALPFYGQSDEAASKTQKPLKTNDVKYSGYQYHSKVQQDKDGDAINIVWEEDFANGIPGSWSNSGTVSGGDTSLWAYRGPNTTPDNSVGSEGSCGGASPIASPSQSNGFIIFDSNGYDDPGEDCGGAAGTGPVPTPHEGILLTDTIDLSGIDEVLIEWYQTVRHFSAIPAMMISSDGGATYDTIYDARNTHPVNESAPQLDEFISIDVSALVGGSSEVIVQMNWSPSDRIPAFNGYYYWMIDDLRLIEKPKNDLAITDYAISSVDPDNFSVSYGFIPHNQNPEVFALGGLFNQGVFDQTNAATRLHVFSASQNYSNLSQEMLLESDSFAITENHIDLSAEPSGAYGMSLAAVSDSVNDFDPTGVRPALDSIEIPNVVEINDTVYAVDNGYADRALGSEYVSGSAQDGARFANALFMKTADTLTAVQINLGSATMPGGQIQIEVKDTTPTFGTAFDETLGGDWANVVLRSDPYTITADDTTRGFVRVEIPQELQGGSVQNRTLSPDLYYVSVSMFSDGGNFPIAILDDNTSIQGGFSSIYYYYPDGRWYTDGNAMHIRPIFAQEPIGIQNVEIGNVSIQPNPASSHLELRVDANTTDDYQVVITNIAGSVVRELNFSNTSTIIENIDVSDLASGIYAVQVKSDAGSTTKKLVISK